MRLHIIGVSVSETMAETTTAMVKVSANSRNMRPTRPVMNSSGMKTAISDIVSEITVKPISRAPRNAASSGDSPSSIAVFDMGGVLLDWNPRHLYRKLIADLAGRADRRAHYYCMLALMRTPDDPEPMLAEGSWGGTIIDVPRGSGGFGYDPHFVDAQTGLTGAELPLEKKNELSHRGKAIRALMARLGERR